MSQQAESFPNTVNHEDKRMTGNKAITIRVAAIQMEFKNGPIEANLEQFVKHSFKEVGSRAEGNAIILPRISPRILLPHLFGCYLDVYHH
jgi:hypothetical protein